MIPSILTSVKKVMGIVQADVSYDDDISLYINMAFATLNQLGVGPALGFRIDDAVPTWDTYPVDVIQMGLVRPYVSLRVRMMFDPPQTSHLNDAIKQEISQLEWRLNVQREGEVWTPPIPPTP